MQFFTYVSEAKEIYDVSGAGDTVIASFAAATLAGFDSESVTRFANKAAGIVVGHIGTTAITVPELKEEVIKFNCEKNRSCYRYNGTRWFLFIQKFY